MLFVSLTGSAWAEIIPADRRIQWDTGVQGGIPNRTIVVDCKTFHGAIGDGIIDDITNVQNCLNGINDGEVVRVPT